MDTERLLVRIIENKLTVLLLLATILDTYIPIHQIEAVRQAAAETADIIAELR